MFKSTSNYIVGALAAFASIASAAPSELGARNPDASGSLTVCLETYYDHCATIQVSTNACNSFGGWLSSYNNAISSATIPGGFRCTFFGDSGCPGGASVTLASGSYPDFSSLPGGTLNFDNAASSVICF